MKEVTGDFWKESERLTNNILVCTVNQVLKEDGRLVMGAGIAKQFRDKHTNLDLIWGYQTYMEQPLLYHYSWPKWLVGLPTKYHWREKSDINLIKSSLIELKYFLKYYNKGNVLMTRPGCGLGGLEWSEIKPIMEQIFCEPELQERIIVINNE